MTATAVRLERPDQATTPQRTSARVVRPRLARAHLEAITADTDTPPRALVVGNAGSGKSGALRHLRAELSERGVDVVVARPGTDLTGIPASDVVLVDDAHLLDHDGLEALARRVADPAAAVVVACRPWPQPDVLRGIARRLEASAPAIVLGQVTAADAAASGAMATMPPACVASLLEACGGASWLVSEALSLHRDDECRGDADHDAIAEALREVIAHRVQTLDAPLREAIEALCVAPGAPSAALTDELIAAGHAEGLLQRNGQPAPIVRAAVRATISVHRVAQLLATAEGLGAGSDELLHGMRDARVAAALLAHADDRLNDDPSRAADLYRRAGESGADSTRVALGLARAAWAQGRIDAATAAAQDLLDSDDSGLRESAWALTASAWAARGLMGEADATYRAMGIDDPVHDAHAAVAALGIADRDRLLAAGQAPAAAVPSPVTVAMGLLARGARASVTGEAQSALADLVRAAEMHTASADDDPLPEVPAVVAALAALHVGEVDVADAVLHDAVAGRRPESWTTPRLLLWRAWVALQQERPREAQSFVQTALSAARPLTPRDRVLADALTVALARRYGDSAELAAAWRTVRAGLLRVRFDVFSLLPLCEFVVTSARVGEPEWMQPHFERALEQLQGLGETSLWSAHLHWTGIQAGILSNRPADLKPHARALLAAAPHNRLAATMAHAGRVWTSVLAGSVDADAVEKAAFALAAVGLAWDGARLAGHGAGRTDDKRVIARLLACARQLHPRDDVRPVLDDPAPTATAAPRPALALSAREREVAALVMQGKTYAEIGDAIFISPRTAEHHIARIRRRLGATTRSDLIAKLRRVLEAEPPDAASARERSHPASEIPLFARDHPLPHSSGVRA